MSSGYATVTISIDDPVVSPDHSDLTGELGCSDTSVSVYRIPADATIALPPAPEQVCIPLGDGSITVTHGPSISAPGLLRIPAGTSTAVHTTDHTVLVVISAATVAQSGDAPVAVDLDRCPFEPPATSTIRTARLTDELGCRGVKVNARILGPGEYVPYHTEGTQEEVFIPVQGPGTMYIDGTHYPTPVGSITRVAPSVPRSALNEGDLEALWVMVGAPPTGGSDEWDPGAEILSTDPRRR